MNKDILKRNHELVELNFQLKNATFLKDKQPVAVGKLD